MRTRVEATRVSYSYHNKLALEEVSFTLGEGECLAIVGPNGSGKSTLLNILAKLTQTTSGKLATSVQRPALVLQSNEIAHNIPMTVEDVVSMGRFPERGLMGRLKQQDIEIVQDSLDRLDIQDLAQHQISELSGGQRQRTFVAQALSQQSELLLLDEPVNGLDLVSRDLILTAIESERSKGVSAAITTHNLEEACLCDKVMLLNTQQVAFGSPDEVLTLENLQLAFGKNFTQVGDRIVLDDGHHH